MLPPAAISVVKGRHRVAEEDALAALIIAKGGRGDQTAGGAAEVIAPILRHHGPDLGQLVDVVRHIRVAQRTPRQVGVAVHTLRSAMCAHHIDSVGNRGLMGLVPRLASPFPSALGPPFRLG